MGINKKGFAIELIVFVVIGIIAVVFFALFIYGFGIVNSNITNGKMDTNNVNVTQAASNTFSHLNEGIAGPGGLELIAAIICIGFALATLIFAYFSSKHALWMAVYILITILLVIFSIYISNAYENLTTDFTFGSTISDFGVAGFITLHLPIWTAVIGLLGIVFSIAGVYIRRGIEA